MTEDEKKDIIDLGKIVRTLYAKKKIFFYVWPIVFILSCIWVLPQPRYYNCSVSLAPEAAGEDIAGGLSSIASNFGVNIGGGGSDAIYPMLYPELMESNEFVVGLLGIKVKTEDGTVNTDYYSYLAKHQKKNWLTQPFTKLKNNISELFSSEPKSGPSKGKKLNPFMLSKFDYNLVEGVKKKISCSVDKKTDVISITVEDQDRFVCATLADSVRQHLQTFITEYRTSKARLDVNHYKQLADSALAEYNTAMKRYSNYCDANQDIILQSSVSERDKLESDMQLKYNTYTAMCTQFEAMKAKLQERTPAFTTLKSATVPIKPVGPKRMLFVAGMLILSTIATSIYIIYKQKLI